MTLRNDLIHEDLVQLVTEIIRLRRVERAARQAMALAHQGRAADAYDALVGVMDLQDHQPIREIA